LDELEGDCVAHLDAFGFRYDIPALMLSALSHYDSSSMRVIGTLTALYLKSGEGWECHLRRYPVLTLAQKAATARFLAELPKLVELDFEDRKVVERALSNYWNEFLKTPRTCKRRGSEASRRVLQERINPHGFSRFWIILSSKGSTAMTALNPTSGEREQVAAICARYGVRKLSLFGSALSNLMRPDSDIDLLVEFVPDAKIGLIEFGLLEQELESLFNRKIDLVPEAGLKPFVRQTLAQTAVPLYA